MFLINARPDLRPLLCSLAWVAATGWVAGCSGGGGDDGEGGTDLTVASLPTSEPTTTDEPTAGDTTGEPGEFGPEDEFVLRLNDDPIPPLVLEMNKAESAELFGDTAREIQLIEVDSKALLENTLNQIKDACGSAWKNDDPDPHHDCSLTPLGQSFKGPDGTWQSSAEYSLLRILTMTPANCDVTGTSIEGLSDLAFAIDGDQCEGQNGGDCDFGGMLADTLGIARTEEFITTSELVLSLQQRLLATHPAIGGDGTKLPVNLEDALKDLTTLSTKLGPMSGHPGILAEGFESFSEVLTPEFKMRVEATSNLRLLDGVDLSVGKDYMSTVVDNTGPSYDDVLEFDFLDPAKFTITGVTENPTVDMRFAVREHDSFINSCAGADECKMNLPEFEADVKAMWPGSAWAIDKWLLESIVVAGGRFKYMNRQFQKCYEVFNSCTFGAEITVGPPFGWTVFDVLFDLGNPPSDQYVWELINEVAQVALHTPPGGDIAEGNADVAFTLFDIPIGITGSQVAESVRPYLQDQAAKISDKLLGDYKKNNGDLDFYYRRGADGLPYLFFSTPEDLKDGTPQDHYPNPGFFDCPQTTADCKVSSLQLGGAGDDTHEKFKLPAGETTLYMQDDTGATYRAVFSVPEGDADEIGVRVAARQ
jgi:hypothetical protein